MKTKKIVIMAILMFAIIGIVGAGVFSYFGTLNTEMNTKQAIRLDGNTFDVPVDEDFYGIGGDVFRSEHTISNGASVDANISICVRGLPTGITISYRYANDTEFTFPITVDARENVDFQIIYTLDLNLHAGSYLIKTYFSSEIA